MKVAPPPLNERHRLDALRDFDILDTDFDADYDELAELAARICHVPIALISLVDSERQWFKASVGLNTRETPRDYAFCSHAILEDEILIVKDTHEDLRFHDNPLVAGDPNIRFYAGAQLLTTEKLPLGTLCVIDRIPRELDDSQRRALEILAKQVMAQLELRRTLKRLRKKALEVKHVSETKDRLYSVIAHDLRTPFSQVLALSEAIEDTLNRDILDKAREYSNDITSVSRSALLLLENTLSWTRLKSGGLQAEIGTVDPKTIVAAALALNHCAAEAKSQSLNVDYSNNGVMIAADSRMLISVLHNLISNAVKFTPEKGVITITTKRVDQNIEIEIADSGQGMDENSILTFHRTGRANPTSGTAGESGTGLGLMLSAELVKKNHGEMKIESAQGKGTRMKLTFPAIAS